MRQARLEDGWRILGLAGSRRRGSPTDMAARGADLGDSPRRCRLPARSWWLFGRGGAWTGSRWLWHARLWPRWSLARGWFGTGNGQGGWPSSRFHPFLEDFCSSGPVRWDLAGRDVDLAWVFCGDAFPARSPFGLEDAAWPVMAGPRKPLPGAVAGWASSCSPPVLRLRAGGFRLDEKPCRWASSASSPAPCRRRNPLLSLPLR